MAGRKLKCVQVDQCASQLKILSSISNEGLVLISQLMLTRKMNVRHTLFESLCILLLSSALQLTRKYHFGFCKLLSVVFAVFSVLRYSLSESFSLTEEPDSIIVVVEGVNNTNVRLVWNFSVDVNESISNVMFTRRRPDGNQSSVIALRYAMSTEFFVLNEFAKEYRAYMPATLELLNVNKEEQYLYTLSVQYTKGSNLSTASSEVAIIVHGMYGIKPFPIKIILCSPRERCRNATQKRKGAGGPPIDYWQLLTCCFLQEQNVII